MGKALVQVPLPLSHACNGQVPRLRLTRADRTDPIPESLEMEMTIDEARSNGRS